MQELYQAVILDHNKNPRNFQKLESATHQIEGYNPLCGDHLWIYARINKARIIEEVTFQGQGCAICKASASMMTESLKGKNLLEAKIIFEEFLALVTKKSSSEKELTHLGKLKLFAGVGQFPARVKCAILSWRSFSQMISDSPESIVKTE